MPILNVRRIDMIKETVAITGATALLFPPLGVACLACGLPGLLVAGAGLLVTDTLVKSYQERNSSSTHQSGEEGGDQE